MWRSLFLTLILFSSIAFAQTQEKPKAIKFDEFGRIGECDFWARLDSLHIELINNSVAKGIVIAYNSIDTLPSEYNSNPLLRQIRNQMTFRGVDLSKYELIDGGFRKELSTELWIVPQGAEPPKPTGTLPKPTIPTNKTFIFANKNIIFYEFNVPNEFLSESTKREQIKMEKEFEEENKKNSAVSSETETTDVDEFYGFTKDEYEEMTFSWAIESFGNLLKERGSSTGTIIFYGDNKYYNIKNVRKHIEVGKRRIAKETDISANRINIVYGGYRVELEAEFWVIPKNGELPKPKPEKREN